jgi:hypothetical protein
LLDCPHEHLVSLRTQRHHAFMVCHARVWIGTPIVSCGNAAVQSFD